MHVKPGRHTLGKHGCIHMDNGMLFIEMLAAKLCGKQLLVGPPLWSKLKYQLLNGLPKTSYVWSPFLHDVLMTLVVS